MQRSHLKPSVSGKKEDLLGILNVTTDHSHMKAWIRDLLVHSTYHVVLLPAFPGLTDLQPSISYCNTEFRILSKPFSAGAVKQAVQRMSRNNASLPPRGNPDIPFLTVR